MSDYYKSLISDEEVIKALIKESKLRNGQIPKENPRIKPNLNFLQRTVNNNVSANDRITRKQEYFKEKNKKDEKDVDEIIDLTTDSKPAVIPCKRKLALPLDVAPIKFVKSQKPFKSQVNDKIVNIKGKAIHKMKFIAPKDTDSESSDSESDKKVFVDSIECNNFVVKSINKNNVEKNFKNSLRDSFSKINLVRSSKVFQSCNISI